MILYAPLSDFGFSVGALILGAITISLYGWLLEVYGRDGDY